MQLLLCVLHVRMISYLMIEGKIQSFKCLLSAHLEYEFAISNALLDNAHSVKC